jgi:hypothetical protein
MEFTFYRGITTTINKAESTLRNIKQDGLSGNEGNWKLEIPDVSDVRQRLNNILSSEKPSADDIFKDTPFKGICACGDENGALYYALCHNKSDNNSVSIIIKFIADLDNIYIDSRDFLCTVFQLWDRETTTLKEKQLLILERLYGNGIDKYFSKCISTTDQQVRIAMGNLAAFDPEIIKDHYNNKKTIAGRYNTHFCSAFFVKAPIAASSILKCEITNKTFSTPKVYINIGDFYKGTFND